MNINQKLENQRKAKNGELLNQELFEECEIEESKEELQDHLFSDFNIIEKNDIFDQNIQFQGYVKKRMFTIFFEKRMMYFLESNRLVLLKVDGNFDEEIPLLKDTVVTALKGNQFQVRSDALKYNKVFESQERDKWI